jgi:hypothetical protein
LEASVPERASQNNDAPVSQIAGSVPFATAAGPLRATVVTVTLAADSGTQMDAVLHGDEMRLKVWPWAKAPEVPEPTVAS